MFQNQIVNNYEQMSLTITQRQAEETMLKFNFDMLDDIFGLMKIGDPL